MAIATAEFSAIEAVLGAVSSTAEALARLRQEMPHLRFLACDAADVSEEPAHSCPFADVHFLDCAGHCVQVVANAAEASGVLLARRRAA
jgi:hypothetical protein